MLRKDSTAKDIALRLKRLLEVLGTGLGSLRPSDLPSIKPSKKSTSKVFSLDIIRKR